MKGVSQFEEPLCGAILQDSSRVMALCLKHGLCGEDFQEEQARKVFAAALAFHQSGKPIDSVTIGLATGLNGELNRMIEDCPTVTHAEYLIQEIKSGSVNRRRIVLHGEIARKLQAGETVDAELVELEGVRSEQKPIQFVDGADWLENEPPEVRQVVLDTFDAGDKVAIIGASKDKKTEHTLTLAIHLAAGREYLTFKSSRAFNVVMFQFEVREAHFWKRVRRICRAYGINPGDIRGRLKIANCRGMSVDVDALADMPTIRNANVIIFDPLYKLATGEETIETFRPILKSFDKLAEKTGATIIYVHHDSKGVQGDKNLRDRGSGSNILARDYDACLVLTPHRDNPDATIIQLLLRNYPPQQPVVVEWINV